jgi:hypothetical protein
MFIRPIDYSRFLRKKDAMTQAKRVQMVYKSPAFRLSYPALFEPKETLNGDLKYSITMLFPSEKLVAQLKASKHPAATWMAADNCKGFFQEITKVARGNFGPDVQMASLKLPNLRNGDLPKPNGKTDENEKGYIIVRSTSKDKPDSRRQDMTIISDPSELYAGCWCRAVLTIAPFYKPQHGVTVYLSGVQKLADDAAFSSRPRIEDEFDAVASDSQPAFDNPPAAAQSGEKMPWE